MKRILSIVLALVLVATLALPVIAAETSKAATSSTTTATTEKPKTTLETGRTIPEGWKAGDDVTITTVWENGKTKSYVIPNVLDIREVTLADNFHIPVGKEDGPFDLKVYSNLKTLMYTVYTDTCINVAGFKNYSAHHARYTKKGGFRHSGGGSPFATGRMGNENDWHGNEKPGDPFGKNSWIGFLKAGYYALDITIYMGRTATGEETKMEKWHGALPILVRVVDPPEATEKK